MIRDMRLETSRLVIRPYVPADLPECFRLMQDPELFTYLDMHVMTPEEYAGLFGWLIDSYDVGFDGDFKYSLNVTRKDTGAHIGWVGVGGVEYDHAQKEIFWLIGREHWGNGYATEAAGALLGYAFDVMGLPEVVALCHTRNVASRRVMEKIGLEARGIMEGLPEAYSYYNGEYLYGITRAEHGARRA